MLPAKSCKIILPAANKSPSFCHYHTEDPRWCPDERTDFLAAFQRTASKVVHPFRPGGNRFL